LLSTKEAGDTSDSIEAAAATGWAAAVLDIVRFR